MKIQDLTTETDVSAAFPTLHELRTHLTFERFLSLYRSARAADGYTLIGLFHENKCVAVMGYRVLFDFVHGKHLYIDDLVVTAKMRSNGLGQQLLEYAEQKARELQCDGLRLCTGVENEGGIKFYERLGWKARALAFKKKFN